MASIVLDLNFRSPFTAALVAVFLSLGAAGSVSAKSTAPLADPVALNIGLSCQWQQRCMDRQKKAMKRALKFVRKEQPPAWRIQLCNRNASKSRSRVDWVGFHNCVRNAALRPAPPPRNVRRSPRRVTQTSVPARSRGERG